MRKKISFLIIILLAFLVLGWRAYQHYVPLDLTKISFSEKGANRWQSYHNDLFDFELKYPNTYFLCSQAKINDRSNINSYRISLRQNTNSPEECVTVGKRIAVYAYRLGRISSFGLSGSSIQLTQNTTVEDIAQQFLAKETEFPSVRHSCHSKSINDISSIICTERAPGELQEITGDRFDVHVLGIHELKNGERILVEVSNGSGGTPYVGEHELQRETIQVFHTVKFANQ